MPSDSAMEVVSFEQVEPRGNRLPMGVGLAIGACASLSLWALIALGVKALLS